MWTQTATTLIPIVVGFVLTGIVGALVTARLQTRVWQRQDDVFQRRHEREQRLVAFNEMSGVLDTRLYVMRQVFWALRRQARGDNSLDLDAARQTYRAALAAWNGGWNRLAALSQVHFGQEAREHLEQLRKEYEELGFALDEALRAFFRGEMHQSSDVPVLGQRLDALEKHTYETNILFLRILDGEPLGASPVRQQESNGRRTGPLALGMRGHAVADLQVRLAQCLGENLDADGLFGWRTEQALRRFQRQHGLPVNGLADSSTWLALDGERRSGEGT